MTQYIFTSGLHAGSAAAEDDDDNSAKGVAGMNREGSEGNDSGELVREPGAFFCARGLASLGCGGPNFLRNLVVELYGSSRLAEMVDDDDAVATTLRKHEVCIVYALPAYVLAPSSDPTTKNLRVVRSRLLQTFAETTMDISAFRNPVALLFTLC